MKKNYIVPMTTVFTMDAHSFIATSDPGRNWEVDFNGEDPDTRLPDKPIEDDPWVIY